MGILGTTLSFCHGVARSEIEFEAQESLGRVSRAAFSISTSHNQLRPREKANLILRVFGCDVVNFPYLETYDSIILADRTDQWLC